MELQVGPFSITPARGSIEPGGCGEFSVIFHASGNQGYLEAIKIDISERDPTDHPDGIVYELAGESCIPGIDARNVDSIFEEYVVSPCLDPFNPTSREYGKREEVFNFGAVISRLKTDGEGQTVRHCEYHALPVYNPQCSRSSFLKGLWVVLFSFYIHVCNNKAIKLLTSS